MSDLDDGLGLTLIIILTVAFCGFITQNQNHVPYQYTINEPNGESNIMPYSGINLAPLPAGWVNDRTWVQIPTANIYQDTSVTHEGKYTVRIDPSSYSFDAFDFAPFIAVSAGDHIYMSAWLKAGGTTPVTQQGAWLALDYYASGYQRINGMDTPYCASIGQSWPQYNDPNKDAAFIHWGRDWTQVTWDFIVPAQARRDSDGAWINISYFIPWIERVGNQAAIWASDIVIYKNPSGDPGAGLPDPPYDLTLPWTTDFADLTDWTIHDGSWSVASNILSGSSSDEAIISVGNGAWSNYEVTATAKIVSGSTRNEVGLIVRFADTLNYIWMGVGGWDYEYCIVKVVGGAHTVIASSGSIVDVDANVDYTLQAIVNGDDLQLWVDSVKKLEVSDADLTSGRVGVRTYNAQVKVSAIEASTDYVPPTYNPVLAGYLMLMMKRS